MLNSAGERSRRAQLFTFQYRCAPCPTLPPSPWRKLPTDSWAYPGSIYYMSDPIQIQALIRHSLRAPRWPWASHTPSQRRVLANHRVRGLGETHSSHTPNLSNLAVICMPQGSHRLAHQACTARNRTLPALRRRRLNLGSALLSSHSSRSLSLLSSPLLISSPAAGRTKRHGRRLAGRTAQAAH